MDEENIIKLGYFNINNKENSIIKNAKHQDNEISMALDKMANTGEKLKDTLLAKDNKNNLENCIDFKKIKSRSL